MFFRGREHESTIWQRFHTSSDGFTVRRFDGLVEVVVSANADRLVDLVLALLNEMPPALSVEVHDVRTSQRWVGVDLARPDVSATLARLKVSLSTWAGAEICVYGSDVQLTITPWLELYVHSTSERWVFVLTGYGLQLREHRTSRSWRLPADGFPRAEDASAALRQAVDKLGMEPA